MTRWRQINECGYHCKPAGPVVEHWLLTAFYGVKCTVWILHKLSLYNLWLTTTVNIQIWPHVISWRNLFWSCVSSGGAPTLAGTSMLLIIWKLSTHKWSAKSNHNGIWGWSIDGLNGWGTHGLNGWGIYGLNGWGSNGLNEWGIHDFSGWGIYG